MAEHQQKHAAEHAERSPARAGRGEVVPQAQREQAAAARAKDRAHARSQRNQRHAQRIV